MWMRTARYCWRFITIRGWQYYVDADGRMVTGQFVRTGEEEFYFGADGKKV